MNINEFERASETQWRIEPRGKMRVPAIIHATEDLILDMDEKVREQLVNVTALPGIVGCAHAMPDAHWGYGFPIGGVAAAPGREGARTATLVLASLDDGVDHMLLWLLQWFGFY